MDGLALIQLHVALESSGQKIRLSGSPLLLEICMSTSTSELRSGGKLHDNDAPTRWLHKTLGPAAKWDHRDKYCFSGLEL